MGFFQARILEWVPFSRGSSRPRDWTQVSCIVGGFFTGEPLGNPIMYQYSASEVVSLLPVLFLWHPTHLRLGSQPQVYHFIINITVYLSKVKNSFKKYNHSIIITPHKFFYLFIFNCDYFFIFGCVGSSLQLMGFLWLRQLGATCGVRASHCCGLSWGVQALGAWPITLHSFNNF